MSQIFIHISIIRVGFAAAVCTAVQKEKAVVFWKGGSFWLATKSTRACSNVNIYGYFGYLRKTKEWSYISR